MWVTLIAIVTNFSKYVLECPAGTYRVPERFRVSRESTGSTVYVMRAGSVSPDYRITLCNGETGGVEEIATHGNVVDRGKSCQAQQAYQKG
tara:strand:- start:741 stop:1013 length:273 start_codon:yes stop_codon:yes gene_type:complete